MQYPLFTMLLLTAAECKRPSYYSESQSESAESVERPSANGTASNLSTSRVPQSHHPITQDTHRTVADIAQQPRVVAGNGREILLEDVVQGDVKQTGSFGGQNFKIFDFEGQQMAVYMFSPFSIYFADEAQDNEVENQGDDASSKNQYLSQAKYGQQRGAGPTFLYQPNFDNRRRLNLIKKLLKRQKKETDSGEISPIPLTITEPTPVIIEGPSTKDIISKLLKASSSSKKKQNKVAYGAGQGGGPGAYLPPGFPAVPIPFPGAFPGPQLAPDFGAVYG